MNTSTDATQRKLTQREVQRQARFKNTTSKLCDRGYKSVDLRVTPARASTRGTLLALPLAVGLISLFLNCAPFSVENKFTVPLGVAVVLSAAAFLALVVAHELIHGFVWAVFARQHFHSVEFGVIWPMLMPYCTCSEPLTKGQYILGALMPFLVLGVGLGVLSIFTGSLGLMILAALMMLGCGGDLLIGLKALIYKTPSRDALYCDHPLEPGVVVFQK